MSRAPTIISTEFPYHISARCINKDWFGAPIEEVWTVMEDYLFFIHHAFSCHIISFVLMSNHFHLLIRFDEPNISEAMAYFMRETSRSIRKPVGRINQTYGSRFHRCLISNERYFSHVYKYIYRNPLEANLCTHAEDYPYSTLCRKLGIYSLRFPTQYDCLLYEDIQNTLNWVNASPKEDYRLSIASALRKPTFKLSGHRYYKKIHPLENTKY